MGRFRDFIQTGTAMGMPLADAVGALLEGATGMPPPIRELLRDCRDESALLSIASAAMQILDDVPSVAVSLIELGIHPLSLFLSPERVNFEAWLNEHPRHKHWFHEGTGNPCIDHSLGILRVARLRPSAWLRALDPGLKMVMRRSAKVTLLEDSCITHLLNQGMCLGGLEIRSCSGMVKMPSLIPGSLQLLFSDAIFLFPKHMDVGGKAEIHGCAGIHALPEELRAERLIVEQCPRLQQLPRVIHGITHLDIVGAPILSFPAGLKELQYLRLASLPNLETLPLPSGEILDAELRCLPSLVEIQAPARSSIRNLFVTQCDRLRRMPDHMGAVSGNVILARLPELEALPSRLSIEGDLRIISCPGLRALPEGLTVGGAVEIRDCPNLGSIPRQIRASLV
jgi:hypothetical protein